MTVPATARRAGPYNGNGATTSFSFSFKTFAAGDLLVVKASSTGVETALVLNSDYSVALNGDQDASPGGSITYPISGAPLPSGEKLTIIGDLDYEQTTDLLGGGAFNARIIEDAFDRVVIQIQQLKEILDRSAVGFISSSADTSLPTPEGNKIIGWDANGTSLINRTSSEFATVSAFSNWLTNVFSGNGSTVSFTLAADPGVVSNMDVAIGGVVQTPNVDFTVSGKIVTFTSAPPSGTNNIVVRYGTALPVPDYLGRHAVYIAAGSMKPRSTNGCANLATVATASNQPDITTLDFDASAQEYAEFSIAMPSSWDESFLFFKVHWSHAATTTNFGVVWDLQAVAVSDNESVAQTFGTAVAVTDTGGTTNNLYTSPESGAVTVAGSPSAGDVVFFRFSRAATNVSDTLAIDARLHGITLYLVTNAGTDQ